MSKFATHVIAAACNHASVRCVPILLKNSVSSNYDLVMTAILTRLMNTGLREVASIGPPQLDSPRKTWNYSNS